MTLSHNETLKAGRLAREFDDFARRAIERQVAAETEAVIEYYFKENEKLRKGIQAVVTLIGTGVNGSVTLAALQELLGAVAEPGEGGKT